MKFCGFQEPKQNTKKKFARECIALGNKNIEQLRISDSIWMVTRCGTGWPHDEIRQRCENSNFIWKTSFDVYPTAPIVTKANIDYVSKRLKQTLPFPLCLM